MSAQLKNFALIRGGVDVSPFFKELCANEKKWLVNTSRQKKIRVQQHTNNIFLRNANREDSLLHVNDIHKSKWTGMSKSFPNTSAFIMAAAKSLNCALARALIVRLKPHSYVYPHTDDGEYYKIRDRYHLVIESGGSMLESGDESVIMKVGELWWFNNKLPHFSYNPSDEWRVHLIFDLLKNKNPPFPSQSL